MSLGFVFFFNSILLGIGLAMDAFSVSLANGLKEPFMKVGKAALISGVFAFFQALMPLIGWLCVHTVAQQFKFFEGMIPWIALALLGFIGGKMIYECVNEKCESQCSCGRLRITTLLVQGVATSIDALSVGFTIAEYDLLSALICILCISVVTFIICFCGVEIGKRAGTLLAGKAGILGGCILIFIGLEIFIKSFI